MARALALVLITGIACSVQAQQMSSLEKLPYNHAERLVVDLQVGLWAQPLPMDFDGDGDLDMVAATSGAPSNGVWFYENVTGQGKGTGAGGEGRGASGRAVGRGASGVLTGEEAREDELRVGQTNLNLRGVNNAPERIAEGRAVGDQGAAAGLAKAGETPAATGRGGVAASASRGAGVGQATPNDDTVTLLASAPVDVVFNAGVWVAKGLEDTTISYVNGEPMVCVPGEAKVRAEGSATPFGGAVANAPAASNPAAATAGGDGKNGKPGKNGIQDGGKAAAGLAGGASSGAGPASVKDCTGVVYADFRKTFFEKGQTIPVVHQRQYNRTRADQWKFVDYDGDGALDVVLGLGVWDDYGWDDAYNAQGVWTNGPLHGYVFVARNEGTTASPKYGALQNVKAGDAPVDVYGAPSPNFADFDGDGDLDLICGEFVDSLTWFENIGSRREPVYAAGRLLARDGAEIRMDLQMLQVIAIDWDADGDTDLVVGQEDGRIALMENTGAVKDHMPVFELPRFFRQEADYLRVGVLPAPAGVDWDADGDQDLIAGDTAGYINFVENTGLRGGMPVWAPPVYLDAGGARVRIQAGLNGGIQGPGERKWGYTVPAVGDWDGDGDFDIVINSIRGEILWYENVGTAKAATLAAAQPIEVEWPGASPKPAWNWWDPRGKQLVTQWRTSPYLGDMTGDGTVDLVLLDTEGYLALFERAKKDGKLVTLAPKRVFMDENGKPLQLNPNRAGKSGRRKFTMADWDGDGKIDLLLDSKNVDFWRNISTKPGEWIFKNMGAVAEQNLLGHTTDPTIVDWNKDGKPDLLIGAEDGCLYFCPNPRSKK